MFLIQLFEMLSRSEEITKRSSGECQTYRSATTKLVGFIFSCELGVIRRFLLSCSAAPVFSNRDPQSIFILHSAS